MDDREKAIGFTRCTSCQERQDNNFGVVASLCAGCRTNKNRIELLTLERDEARTELVNAQQKLETIRKLHELHVAF